MKRRKIGKVGKVGNVEQVETSRESRGKNGQGNQCQSLGVKFQSPKTNQKYQKVPTSI